MTHSGAEGESAPRLPHEHDESSDSGTSEPRAVIRRAHDDVKSGQVDTDRGDVVDDVYRRTLKESPKSAPKRR